MRYLTESEYLLIKDRIHVDYKGVRWIKITLPEPGGAFILDRVVVITDPIPTTLSPQGVRMFACNPDEWAEAHRHPEYI